MKWSYFLDALFEKGSGKLNYKVSGNDRVGRKALARHCGQWMRVLRQYQIVSETGRYVELRGGYYCTKCGFFARDIGIM